MGLDVNLISQFAKLTTEEKKTSNESIVYGRAIYDSESGMTYVQIDGSVNPNNSEPIWTPAVSSVAIRSDDKNNGERVAVMIKDHTATIIGNTSSPAARDDDVQAQNGIIESQGGQLTTLDSLLAHDVTADEIQALSGTIRNLTTLNAAIGNIEAVTAAIETLAARIATFDKVTINDMYAFNAEVDTLKATIASITNIDATLLTVINAEIDNLTSVTGKFTYLSSEFLTASTAKIKSLETNKLDANFANIKYAEIDKAKIYELYAQSGLIENIVASDGTFTGTLIGVTIKGDIIEGNTIIAESLKLRGEDGLYYQLNINGESVEASQTEYNSLNGSVIAVNSIDASKIRVEDLVAFGATIGGFQIKDHAIHSITKETIDSPMRGSYIGEDGQISFGDDKYFLKYYLDPEDNTYKLAISAESILFGAGDQSSADDLKELMKRIKMGKYTHQNGDIDPCIELSEGENALKQVITNSKTMFLDGSDVGTSIDKDGVDTKNATVNGDFRQGNYVWANHGSRGNYGLMWKEITN